MPLPLTSPPCKDCYSAKTAASAMGLKNVEYARKLLGEPDMIEKGPTAERFLYFPETVEKAKKALEEKREKCRRDRGKRTCYLCREKFQQSELISGMCLTCKAKNIVANFTCCGDCICHLPEYRRFCIIREAVALYGNELKAKAKAKQK